jgi:quercetin dioxygenase-like cupin family protein
MKIRRVVAGNVNGKSVFLTDGDTPHTYNYKHVPGFSTSLIWSTSQDQELTESSQDPVGPRSSLLPAQGESRFMMVSFPPDSIFLSESFDFQAAIAEQQEHLIGLFEAFEPEQPGMHKTHTVDFAVIVKGPIWLELDDGQERKLEAGDVVVQQGNRHAWRNKGVEEAVVSFVLLGAK